VRLETAGFHHALRFRRATRPKDCVSVVAIPNDPRTTRRRFAKMLKRTMFLAALTLLVLPLATAQAGLRIGIGIGTPPPYPYYIYTFPRPAVVVAPPVAVAPALVPPPAYTVQPAVPVYPPSAPVQTAPATSVYAPPVH
jgi:hypothetical protein